MADSVKERENKIFEAEISEATREATPSRTYKDYSLTRSRSKLISDFQNMIAENFPEYEVLYNYKASGLDPSCHPACTPIEFLFKKDGQYVLAVVIVRQNTYRGMNVIGTRKICESLNIPYLRFFEEYPNEESYVVPRIREHL